ncbi:MAG: Stp1/IreP family PP2C-type Ser/Thr phosphatase [Acidobacteria bacterium]|nr:Stp1/IreP family PP2C-type Ser/Thr phosphatase [Acidobacteriota bacterium]
MQIDFGVSTSQGRVRTSNEDSYAADLANRLFLVADGMGGHAAGEIASRMAATAVEQFVAGERTVAGSLGELLLRAAQAANSRIYDAQCHKPELSGMGSTLTALALSDSTYHIAHVGDSRAYLLRAGVLDQLTRDHSLVWHLFENGMLGKDELSSHPQKNLITRSIGPHLNVEVDIECGEAHEGDTFLLCSDGLTDVLSDEDLRQKLSNADASPQQLGDDLVREANARGGPDNITVIVIRIRPDR